MDTVAPYRALIERILNAWAELDRKCPTSGVEPCLIFDETHNYYLLKDVGWAGTERVLRTMLQVRIKEGKIWIEEDWAEKGIATNLMREGVPKEDIALGFQPPTLRPYTEFAIA